MTTQAAVPAPSRPTAGMIGLFLTEMWERFSFYGMKALLVPFLIAAFGYTEAAAKEALGTYVLLVYLSPLFAGIIADRFLNLRMSIYVGAIVMALGHFAMALHSLTFVGMALIIAGNGFFKPCATNMVGALYPETHPYRSSAYAWFYFGINLGAFISPMICGWLRQSYGADWGFAVAGVGMLIGLVTFYRFELKLGTAGLRPSEAALVQSNSVRISGRHWKTVLAVSAITTIIVTVLTLGRGILDYAWTPTWALGSDAGAATLFLVRMGIVIVILIGYTKLVPRTAETRPLTKEEKDRTWVIAAVTFAMFFLVIALEQAGGTLNLFAQNKTEETLLGIKIPYEFYQSVNPLAVMLLSVVSVWLWKKLDARGVTDLQKLGPGLLLIAVVFFLLKGADLATANGAKASPAWLFSIYFFIAAGEVCISVIGLSVVNKLAPKHMQAFFIAVFFLGIAVGGYLAGTGEEILKSLGVDPWLTLGAVCTALGVIYIVGAKKLRALSHGVI